MSSHWGAIFDFDGVLVDSIPYQRESWVSLAQDEGLPFEDEDFEKGFGRTNEMIVREVLSWSQDEAEVERLACRKEAIYKQIVETRGLEERKGAEHLLHYLHSQRVPMAIASMGPKETIDLAFHFVPLSKYFPVIISAMDVTESKPSPQVFTRAAEKLSLQAENCVVFEDAPVGVQAARAAGMRVVAVSSTHSSAYLKGADVVVGELSEVQPDGIYKWFAVSSQEDETKKRSQSVQTRFMER